MRVYFADIGSIDMNWFTNCAYLIWTHTCMYTCERHISIFHEAHSATNCPSHHTPPHTHTNSLSSRHSLEYTCTHTHPHTQNALGTLNTNTISYYSAGIKQYLSNLSKNPLVFQQRTDQLHNTFPNCCGNCACSVHHSYWMVDPCSPNGTKVDRLHGAWLLVVWPLWWVWCWSCPLFHICYVPCSPDWNFCCACMGQWKQQQRISLDPGCFYNHCRWEKNKD